MMELTTEQENQVTVVHLAGRVDIHSCDNLETTLCTILEQKKNHIIIDCKEVDYLSSGGMRAFLVAMKEAEKTNSSLVFCGFQKQVEEVLHFAGVIKYFPNYKSIEAAKKAFSETSKH
jgi:anti-sigma B factor antagonist